MSLVRTTGGITFLYEIYIDAWKKNATVWSVIYVALNTNLVSGDAQSIIKSTL
jgi:hypothetical protein